MSLDQDIARQYQRRTGKEGLYSGIYTDFVFEEKKLKLRQLLKGVVAGDRSILEIGAGNGSNIPLLEACGFDRKNICLNEMLPDRTKQIIANYPDIHVYQGNAIDLDFGRKFDFVFQSTVFTSILKSRQRQLLAEKMQQLLAPGGSIIWYDFIYNNPGNPDVRKVDVKELTSLFSGYPMQYTKVTLAPPIGRRVGKLYPVFNIVPLRSHILALIKKVEKAR